MDWGAFASLLGLYFFSVKIGFAWYGVLKLPEGADAIGAKLNGHGKYEV